MRSLIEGITKNVLASVKIVLYIRTLIVADLIEKCLRLFSLVDYYNYHNIPLLNSEKE